MRGIGILLIFSVPPPAPPLRSSASSVCSASPFCDALYLPLVAPTINERLINIDLLFAKIAHSKANVRIIGIMLTSKLYLSYYISIGNEYTYHLS